MKDVYKNKNSDKRNRIINSSLKEFSKNGFEKASTNNIVKNAGISKGLLFHYFKSKKELYQYLEVFAIKTYFSTINEEIDWNESDILTRVKQIAIIKTKIAESYPQIGDFLKVIFEDMTVEQIDKKISSYLPEITGRVFTHNIDFSCFKDDLDARKVINIIRLFFEKYREEFAQNLQNSKYKYDKEYMLKELDEYIDIFKLAFYK